MPNLLSAALCFHSLSNNHLDRLHNPPRRPQKKRRVKTSLYLIHKFAKGINAIPTKRRTMFSKNEWVFEFDESEYPQGYGPCAGKITDPHLKAGPYVEWVDGNSPGPVKRKHLVKAPAPGETVVFCGNHYIVVCYTSKGVKLQAVEGQPPKKRERKSGA